MDGGQWRQKRENVYKQNLFFPFIASHSKSVHTSSLSVFTPPPSDRTLLPLPLALAPPLAVPTALAVTQVRVLTLTAPSLWRLISACDTLSPHHANGAAALGPRVHMPSALYQRASGDTAGPIRGPPTRPPARIMRVWTTEKVVGGIGKGRRGEEEGGGDNACIRNKKSRGGREEEEQEREPGVKRSHGNVLKADYK